MEENNIQNVLLENGKIKFMFEEITKRIRASLIKSIEILDGKVPTEKEFHDKLSQEVLVENDEQKTVFRWKDRIILKVGPVKEDSAGVSGYLEEADLSHLGKSTEEGRSGIEPSDPSDYWKKS
jgi:hypothetical protein